MPNLPTVRVTFRITDTYSMDVQVLTPKEAMESVHRKLEEGPLRIEGAKLVQSEYSIPRWEYVKAATRKRNKSRTRGRHKATPDH